MAYIHGAYGEVGKTQAQNAAQSSTVACYIGTAPIHLVRGYKDKDLVNRPIKLTDWQQAVQTIGYSDDWEHYTLCEAIKAHFDNPMGNIGPIYVINVLDPDKLADEAEITSTVSLTNGRAELHTDQIILDSIAVADKAEGVDYSIDYDYTAGKLIFTAIKDDVTSLSITAKTLTATVSTEDIVGGVTAAGEYTGIPAAELIYTTDYQVATLFAAPGWSHIDEVRNRLVKACQGLNGHWYGYCYTDARGATISEAIAWKAEHGYNSQYETICWPQVIDNTGKVYHLSTLSVWRQMLVDATHDGVPFETASNKAVPGLKQYFGESSTNRGYDKERANALNEKGIRTVAPDSGNLVLWGGHTAAYTYGATTDALQIFDTNVRMIGYILNSFQREWGSRIDEPMTLQLKDEIINREQDKLDALVAQGALIGSPTITFLASKNSTTDMMNGDFRFDHIVTPTPQLKSASATVAYSDSGFSVYTSEE